MFARAVRAMPNAMYAAKLANISLCGDAVKIAETSIGNWTPTILVDITVRGVMSSRSYELDNF